jgi:uncharacterized membrane protein YdjX (TVP38/TMEM64 family)
MTDTQAMRSRTTSCGKTPERQSCEEAAPEESLDFDCTGERRRQRWRLLAVSILAIVVVALAIYQPVAMVDALAWGEALAPHPATVPLLILLQALLLALALPGTLMLWIVAPFYHPLAAAAILTTGSTLGALGAYYTARWLGRAWRPGPTGQRVLRLLRRQGDVWTQLALRVLPGFPHSVVNYGSGTLGLPLPGFLLAAAAGLGAKWVVYAYAVQTLMQSGIEGESISPASLLPLLALVALLAGGRWLRGRLRQG